MSNTDFTPKTKKRLIYTSTSVADPDFRYIIGTIFTGERIQVIDQIYFSDKWKEYDTCGLLEDQIANKFVSLGAAVLGIDPEEFDGAYKADPSGYLAAHLDDFVEALLEIGNSNGMSTFPFVLGQQFPDFETPFTTYLETVEEEYEVLKNFENEDYEEFPFTQLEPEPEP